MTLILSRTSFAKTLTNWRHSRGRPIRARACAPPSMAILIRRSTPRSRPRAALGPTHLLLLHESFAYHVVDGRFDKRRGNRLVMSVAVAVVWNERLIGLDVGAQLLHRL